MAHVQGLEWDSHSTRIINKQIKNEISKTHSFVILYWKKVLYIQKGNKTEQWNIHLLLVKQIFIFRGMSTYFHIFFQHSNQVPYGIWERKVSLRNWSSIIFCYWDTCKKKKILIIQEIQLKAGKIAKSLITDRRNFRAVRGWCRFLSHGRLSLRHCIIV